MASAIEQILRRIVGEERSAALMASLHIAPSLRAAAGNVAPRAIVAQSLTMLLFDALVDDVPEAARFVAEHGRAAPIVFDHGAVRTIDGPTGALPSGEAAITRLLAPLGFAPTGTYPLERLRMTGRAYTHLDHPDQIAQFFVSELHLTRFPDEAQAVSARVFGRSVDPLDPDGSRLLDRLATDNSLPIDAAIDLVRRLLPCFAPQHDAPTWDDYAILRRHSDELAWIATEGNRFNHATARVPDVATLADRLKAQGYAMKEEVEVSRDGSVRQTAVRAAKVERYFRSGAVTISRTVPGSFFEFISRDSIDIDGSGRLDLRFDSSNAQGIFTMTAARAEAA